MAKGSARTGSFTPKPACSKPGDMFSTSLPRQGSISLSSLSRRESTGMSSLSRRGSIGSAPISIPEEHHYLSMLAKVARTAVAMAAYSVEAVCMALIGPALLDLRLLTHTTTSEISLIFLVQGAMGLVSCVVAGHILDKINHYLVVGVSLVLIALMYAAAPWSNNLGTVLLTLGTPGFFICAVAMGANLMGLELWHDNSGPVLQALNFVGIAGFMVAPMLVQPFIMVAEDDDTQDTNVNHMDAENTNGELVPFPSFTTEDNSRTMVVFTEDVTTGRYASDNFTRAGAKTKWGFTEELNSFVTDTPVDDDETDVKYAFWIAAGLCFVVGLLCTGIFFVSRSSIKRETRTFKDGDNRGNSKSLFVTLAVLVFFFNVFYAGIEVGYAGLLVTFVVEHLNWTKKTGTWLLTLLQGANCFVTLICIPVSKFVKPNVLIAIDLVILNVTFIAQALFVEHHDSVMWVCTAAVAIGYGIILPSTLAWLDTVIEVNGKFSSAYWAGYFVGYMALPALSGYMFKEVDQLCFIYLNLGCSVVMTLFFVLLSFIVSRYKPSKCLDTPL